MTSDIIVACIYISAGTATGVHIEPINSSTLPVQVTLSGNASTVRKFYFDNEKFRQENRSLAMMVKNPACSVWPELASANILEESNSSCGFVAEIAYTEDLSGAILKIKIFNSPDRNELVELVAFEDIVQVFNYTIINVTTTTSVSETSSETSSNNMPVTTSEIEVGFNVITESISSRSNTVLLALVAVLIVVVVILGVILCLICRRSHKYQNYSTRRHSQSFCGPSTPTDPQHCSTPEPMNPSLHCTDSCPHLSIPSNTQQVTSADISDHDRSRTAFLNPERDPG